MVCPLPGKLICHKDIPEMAITSVTLHSQISDSCIVSPLSLFYYLTPTSKECDFLSILDNWCPSYALYNKIEEKNDKDKHILI